MQYNGTVYRPPIEAQSFLVPITEGCTHNTCTFCNMYEGIPFRMLPLYEVEEYLSQAQVRGGRRYCESVERVYFVGADPFALSANNLLRRIDLVKRYFPNASVFTMYARIDNVAAKSDDDLQTLKDAGVDDLYIGMESALDDVLLYLNKGYMVHQMLEQCERLNEVGIRTATCLCLE